MIISFFQILELWIQWIIIENTYPIPSKLCTILIRSVPEVLEEIPRRKTTWFCYRLSENVLGGG